MRLTKEIKLKIEMIKAPLLLVGGDSSEFFSEADSRDLFFLEGGEVKIANIRELIRWLYLKPAFSKNKLVIIKDVEKVNLQSANALLKILEEPPDFSRIILTTQEEQKILPTILSRCIKIKFPVLQITSEPGEYLSPETLSKKSLSERFKWVEKVYQLNDLEQILILWLDFYRKKLLSGEDVVSLLKEIQEARDLLSSNISLKLLLENLTLRF